MDQRRYDNPLISRYASEDMSRIFSPEKKIRLWRELWIALAKGEKALGLPLSQEGIEEMEAMRDSIDFQRAQHWESRLRHDVMAHVKTFGEAAPHAAPFIHLGATSCFVTDNTDMILLCEGLELLEEKLERAIYLLAEFAEKTADLPVLGFTHFQPAQPVTMGKRVTLWIQDLLWDLEEIRFRRKNLRLRGVKGTTGTQASFLALFHGDEEKVKALEDMVVHEMGWEKAYPVTGQTVSRKVDGQILQTLCGIASSFHKITNDIRILQHLGEMEEPFEKEQIGSSAMAYKRNPMRSERISSLSKYLMSLSANGYLVHGTQWLERTLDDSANRRIAIAQGFLCADGILELGINVFTDPVIYPKVMERRLLEALPFFATENILMEETAGGGNRQRLHEKIRVHSMAVKKVISETGGENDLLLRLENDPDFTLTKEEMEELISITDVIGRAPGQVREFLAEEVYPALSRNAKNERKGVVRV